MSASSRPNAVGKLSVDAAETAESARYTAYGEFVKDELEAQDTQGIVRTAWPRRHHDIVNARHVLFALAALSTKSAATCTLPRAASMWLSIALVLFFLSAIAALLSNAPLVYQGRPGREDQNAARRRQYLRPHHPRATRWAAETKLDYALGLPWVGPVTSVHLTKALTHPGGGHGDWGNRRASHRAACTAGSADGAGLKLS